MLDVSQISKLFFSLNLEVKQYIIANAQNPDQINQVTFIKNNQNGFIC